MRRSSCNDALDDPRSIQIPGTPIEPESMLVVPLQVGGEVIGTLNVARMGEEESHFTEYEFELTQLFGGQASIALQNAEAHLAMKVRADHDALTGLGNHGAFQRDLGAALDGARPDPFAVLMLDLDAFKRFNDTKGHPAGDALLRSIAEAISGSIRVGDRAYRYGGDEFSVILSPIHEGGAQEVAERIQAAVKALTIHDAAPVTVTVGIACYPVDGETKAELVAAADARLFMTKPSSARDNVEASVAREAYLSALHDTAVTLMDRLEPAEVLETIVKRASTLLGATSGYLYLVDEAAGDLVVEVGIGIFADWSRLPARARGRHRRPSLADRPAPGRGRLRQLGAPLRGDAGRPVRLDDRRAAHLGRPGDRGDRGQLGRPASGPMASARSRSSAGSPSWPRSPSTTPGCSPRSSARSSNGPPQKRACAAARSVTG